MKINRIFLDIDGVLANWTKGTCERLGIEYPKNFEFPDQGWLASQVGQKIIQNKTKDFEFWDNLEKYPWADELVKIVNDSGKKWMFLTKPMKTPYCYSGKFSWVNRHYPKYWNKIWIASGETESKSEMCRDSGDILIDDFEKNTASWENSGGRTFHWKEITPDFDYRSKLENLKKFLNDV